MSIIEVNHVTKEYRLDHMKSLKQTALNTFSRLRGKPKPKPTHARVKSRLDSFLILCSNTIIDFERYSIEVT